MGFATPAHCETTVCPGNVTAESIARRLASTANATSVRPTPRGGIHPAVTWCYESVGGLLERTTCVVRLSDSSDGMVRRPPLPVSDSNFLRRYKERPLVALFHD